MTYLAEILCSIFIRDLFVFGHTVNRIFLWGKPNLHMISSTEACSSNYIFSQCSPVRNKAMPTVSPVETLKCVWLPMYFLLPSVHNLLKPILLLLISVPLIFQSRIFYFPWGAEGNRFEKQTESLSSRFTKLRHSFVKKLDLAILNTR